MGCYDQSSELVHRIPYPSAGEPELGSASRHKLFPIERRERPALHKPTDELIFHSLIASGNKLARRNPWGAVGSLIFQALLLGAVAVIPLFHTDPLPRRETSTSVYLQAPVTVKPIVAQIKKSRPTVSHTPAKADIPAPVQTTHEPIRTEVNSASVLTAGAVSGFGDGAPSGPQDGAPAVPAPPKAPEPAPVKRIRVASGVAQANLIRDVPPQYPPQAGRERIEGTVVLLAVIGTDGTVKDVRVESGPPQLTQAAIDAVKQWRYRPYLLNGVPVEIDSRITINFTMSRG